jgi:hypothetical protein
MKALRERSRGWLRIAMFMRRAVVDRFAGIQAVLLSPTRWLRSVAALATLAALILGLLLGSEGAVARFDAGLGFAGGTAGMVLPLSAVSLVSDDLAALGGWIMPPAVAQPTYPGGSLVGLFNRPGVIGGFAAGFLGAGVLGLLFGHGVVGELSSFVAVLGLAFQIALILMLARLIWTWWNIDQTDARNGLSPRQLADAYGRSRNEVLPDIDPVTNADTAIGGPAGGTFTQTDRSRP